MSNKVNIKEIFIKLLREIDSRGTMTWDEIQEFLHAARGTKRTKSIKTITRYVRNRNWTNYQPAKKVLTEIKEIIYPKRCTDVTISFLKKEKRGVYAIHPEKLSYWKYDSVTDIKDPFPYSPKQKYGLELGRPDYHIGVALKKMTRGTGIEEFI